MEKRKAIWPMLRAGLAAAALSLAGCTAYGYAPGYGYGYGAPGYAPGYAYGYDSGYGPAYYGSYGPGYYGPGYYNGLLIGGRVGVGRERFVRGHGRVVRRGFASPSRGFAAAHGGIGKFGMRMGGRAGGAHVAGGHGGGRAGGGVGHFGGRER